MVRINLIGRGIDESTLYINNLVDMYAYYVLRDSTRKLLFIELN